MIEIIQRREVTYTDHYTLHFRLEGRRAGGLAFVCDANGAVDESKLAPEALENYRKCLSGVVDGHRVIEEDLEKFSRKHVQEKIGKCPCGEKVYLSGFTNACNGCNRDYNMSGQELAPRAQWGEETGESVQDILNIDCRTPEENLDGDER